MLFHVNPIASQCIVFLAEMTEIRDFLISFEKTLNTSGQLFLVQTWFFIRKGPRVSEFDKGPEMMEQKIKGSSIMCKFAQVDWMIGSQTERERDGYVVVTQYTSSSGPVKHSSPT